MVFFCGGDIMPNCVLYINNSADNVVDKSIDDITSLNVQYKEPTSVINPVVIMSYHPNYLDANYLYLSDFSRYYFVKNITLEHQRLIFECHVDVLMSAKDEILNKTCFIKRQEKVFAQKLDNKKGVIYDSEYPVRADYVTYSKNIGNVGNGVAYYLTVNGGVL